MRKLNVDITKYSPELWRSIETLRKSNPELADNLQNQSDVFRDLAIPTMGNLLAYKQHLQEAEGVGAHVHVWVNDFHEVRGIHGLDAHDGALQTFGQIAFELTEKYGGKAFRYGGHFFRFHFRDENAAHGFARELRGALEQLPRVGDTHNLSACIGVGSNSVDADLSLDTARAQLGSPRKHEPGDAPTVIHSMFSLDTPAEALAKSEEMLAKSKPTFKYPGLGLPDDRRETYIVENKGTAHKTKGLAMGNSLPKEHRHYGYPNTVLRDYVTEGKGWPRETPMGAAGVEDPDRKNVHAYVRADLPDSTLMATKLHEDFHLMDHRLAAKFKEKGYSGSSGYISNLLSSSLDPLERDAVSEFMRRRDASRAPGEKWPYIVSFLNDKREREKFADVPRYSDPAWPVTPEDLREHDGYMKRAYRQAQETARNVTFENYEEMLEQTKEKDALYREYERRVNERVDSLYNAKVKEIEAKFGEQRRALRQAYWDKKPEHEQRYLGSIDKMHFGEYEYPKEMRLPKRPELTDPSVWPIKREIAAQLEQEAKLRSRKS